MTQGCLRPVQDYSKTYFLEIMFTERNFGNEDIGRFERALDRIGLDAKWHKRDGHHVYRFPKPFKERDVMWINGILDVLGAESWEYGEYGENARKELKGRKLDFLQKILDFGREHPIMVGNGKIIFRDCCPAAFDESFVVSLHIHREGGAYFKYESDTMSHSTTNPELLIDEGKRYMPHDYFDFARSFHFYENAEMEVDHFDALRRGT